EEAIRAHPGMRIVRSQSGDFRRSGGKQVMEAFIQALGREFDAVYAHNDDMALGAIQALDAAGLKPGKDVLIISIDAVRAAFEAMIAGTLNATVECNPLMGPLLFDTIEKHVRGETIPKKIINPDRLFEQKDAAEAVKEREY
ncbi:MAG: LacI family transcriptional regulator, partial [Planctomycetota bacterium]